MTKENKINNLDNKGLQAIGNYTKSAVKSFEENIVNKENYLENVEEKLNNKHNFQ